MPAAMPLAHKTAIGRFHKGIARILSPPWNTGERGGKNGTLPADYGALRLPSIAAHLIAAHLADSIAVPSAAR